MNLEKLLNICFFFDAVKLQKEAVICPDTKKWLSQSEQEGNFE